MQTLFLTHFPVPSPQAGVVGGLDANPTVPFCINAVPSENKRTEPFADAGFDLNRLLVQHPAATFFLRVNGDALAEAGMGNRDVLIVDRSLEPTAGKLVVVVVNGDFTIQYFHGIQKKFFTLKGKNPGEWEVQKEANVEIWGGVCLCHSPCLIRKARRFLRWSIATISMFPASRFSTPSSKGVRWWYCRITTAAWWPARRRPERWELE